MSDDVKRGGSDEAQRDEENFRRETGIDFSAITRQEEQGLRRILFQRLTEGELVGGQNTFRAGQKYTDLQVSEQVELAFADDPDTVIGYAVVTGVVATDLDTLLRRHAVNNHGVIADKVPAHKAYDALLGILRGIYGEDTPLDATFTAVYLDRT